MKEEIYSLIISSLTALSFGMFLSAQPASLYEKLGEVQKDFELIKDPSIFSSTYNSLIFVGAFIASCFSSLLSSASKKYVLFLSNIFYIVGASIIIFSFGAYTVLAARIVMGVGVGFTCCSLPAYIFSISNDENRGFFMSFTSIGIVSGLVVGSVIASCINAYRVVYSIILVYLLTHTLILTIIKNFKQNHELKTGYGLFDLLSNPRAYKSMLIAATFHIGQHASGIDYFSIFMDDIYKGSGHPKLLTVMSLLFSAIVCVFSGFYTDRLGRKPLIVVSASILGASTAIMALRFKHFSVVFAYLFGYNIGLSSIPWFISNEIFPEAYAGPATSFSVGINWLSAFIFSLILKPLHDKHGDIVFILYTIFMSILVGISIFLFKETKNCKVDFQ